MHYPIYQVDAFATGPFTGNPAGVCLLQQPVETSWMQQVADEMHCAETAFICPEPNGVLRLRWFTPTAEVDLCGHATLAAAHILFAEGATMERRELAFSTRSGILTASRNDDAITLNFPSTPPAAVQSMPGLFAALGLSPDQAAFLGRSRFDAFVELRSEDAVRAVAPDFAALRAVDTTRAVIITAAASPTASPGTTFVSRFFAPKVGVNEDHVTGSAHCALAPYWHKRLGQASMRGLQVSRRSGAVNVRCLDDRVELGGQCITILRGKLHG